MQALAKALGVNLSVAYLDGKLGHGDAVDFVKFENGGGNEANGIEEVVLLYRYVERASPFNHISNSTQANVDPRPGHYDILEHRAHEHLSSTASSSVTPSVMQ
jgi:hypothetical protein